MKIILGAAVTMALLAGAMSATAQGQSPQKPGEVYSLYVDGLACPFCAYGIEKELSGLNAVERVEIDMARGVVVVTLAPGASVAEALFRKAVDNAGFTLRKVEGPVSKKTAQ